MTKISIIIPAKNESQGLNNILPRLQSLTEVNEIIVVNDGSDDDTPDIAQRHGAKLITHPYAIGNGGAIKSGALASSSEILIFMDGDGQHDPKDIPRLIQRLEKGHDMVIGARSHSSQAGFGRSVANQFYNRLASYMTGQRIMDLTSGFRAVRADKFREFIYLLPNGFSYPTTITMAFFRAGYLVGFEPIVAAKRKGSSHIHPLKDGIRFLLIIFKIATLYSPLKIFVPISASFFSLGLGYYMYTFFSQGRFTNMSALLLTSSIIVFLIGLVSEQITQLVYSKKSSL